MAVIKKGWRGLPPAFIFSYKFSRGNGEQHFYLRLSCADLSVFFMSKAMVMGPTPPGTEAIFPAISVAFSKST